MTQFVLFLDVFDVYEYLVISGYSQDRSCIALCGLRTFNGNALLEKMSACLKNFTC